MCVHLVLRVYHINIKRGNFTDITLLRLKPPPLSGHRSSCILCTCNEGGRSGHRSTCSSIQGLRNLSCTSPWITKHYTASRCSPCNLSSSGYNKRHWRWYPIYCIFKKYHQCHVRRVYAWCIEIASLLVQISLTLYRESPIYCPRLYPIHLPGYISGFYSS